MTKRLTYALVAASLAAAFAACATSTSPDVGLEGLAIATVAPGTIIPGTTIVVTGASFVDAQWGAATLHLTGTANGAAVDVSWPATFVDFGTLTVEVDATMLAQIGSAADLAGNAEIDYVSTTDHKTYSSDPLAVTLAFRQSLTPTPTTIQDTGVIFVNDALEIDGSGFLLGGDEGQSVAHVAGCFTPASAPTGPCAPIAALDVPMVPASPLDRTKATFPFQPALVGIDAGSFTGTVTVVNQQLGGTAQSAAAHAVSYTIVTSQIFSVTPDAASLGQYVFVQGGGFVGGEASALTELQLSGTFTKTGGSAAPIAMTLIPDFVDGRSVRYVINTDDTLGHALNLYTETGSFTGTITPVVSYGSDMVTGTGTTVTFAIAPVKQVVYLDYETSYTEALRDFGMRAVDNVIRDRILAVCNRTYLGVNVEFRATPPTDFALYSDVDIVGVDPNNMGLFGYDNTPGKDSGNLRLYDTLGGVNAATQADGYPGYGGVFVQSLMGFSQHPGTFATAVDGADPTFDATFDEFRSDRGGQPVSSADLGAPLVALTDGSACPASDRASKLSCAVFVMGNLIGGTLAHELGHSLGLAYPYTDGNFHDTGDQPNRLMDAGDQRPFLERAELGGQGPAVFCDDEYTYLRMILPSTAPANDVTRPGCD